MATHSSILAWRIPWTEEPGGLQSMGSQSWTRLSNFTPLIFKHWQQIQIFFPITEDKLEMPKVCFGLQAASLQPLLQASHHSPAFK